MQKCACKYTHIHTHAHACTHTLTNTHMCTYTYILNSQVKRLYRLEASDIDTFTELISTHFVFMHIDGHSINIIDTLTHVSTQTKRIDKYPCIDTCLQGREVAQAGW